MAGLLADWAAARPAAWRSRALPPAHLLRIVCDTAPDFDAALAMLHDTPLLNGGTRLAAVMHPAEGRLELAGYEREGRVSEILDLAA